LKRRAHDTRERGKLGNILTTKVNRAGGPGIDQTKIDVCALLPRTGGGFAFHASGATVQYMLARRNLL
jgi:hypothetical protein